MPDAFAHPPRHHLTRRARSAALAGVAAWLIPWTVMLWRQLPLHGASPRVRNFWVALDATEAAVFATAAALHLTERRAQLPVLKAAAGLLVFDATADLALARTRRERAAALLMLPAELGAAAWCLRIARFARYELAGFDTDAPGDDA